MLRIHLVRFCMAAFLLLLASCTSVYVQRASSPGFDALGIPPGPEPIGVRFTSADDRVVVEVRLLQDPLREGHKFVTSKSPWVSQCVLMNEQTKKCGFTLLTEAHCEILNATLAEATAVKPATATLCFTKADFVDFTFDPAMPHILVIRTAFGSDEASWSLEWAANGRKPAAFKPGDCL